MAPRWSKSCPFCGSEETGIGEQVNVDGVPIGWAVECVCCDCVGPVHDTTAEAASAWDNRHEGEQK
jgi:Lar family restriction alleviation protein